MTSVCDLPPELRALIFERLSLSTFINLSYAVPAMIPELISTLKIMDKDDGQSIKIISYSHISGFLRLAEVEPEIYLTSLPETFSLVRSRLRTGDLDLANDFLKQHQRQDQTLRMAVDGHGFIEWDHGTLVWSLEAVSEDRALKQLREGALTPPIDPRKLVLTPSNVIISHHIILDSQVIRSGMGWLFGSLFRGDVPRIEYRFGATERSVDYAEVAWNINGSFSPVRAELPLDYQNVHLKEVIYPLNIRTLIPLLQMCPNITKVGYVPATYGDLNDAMRSRPHITFVLYYWEAPEWSYIAYPDRVVLPETY